MRPTLRLQRAAEKGTGFGAELGQSDDIGIVPDDGIDDSGAAGAAAVPDVPGQEFH
jgi:hypothetical protein